MKILKEMDDSRQDMVCGRVTDFFLEKSNIGVKDLTGKAGKVAGLAKVENFPDDRWVCFAMWPDTIHRVDDASYLKEGTIQRAHPGPPGNNQRAIQVK